MSVCELDHQPGLPDIGSEAWPASSQRSRRTGCAATPIPHTEGIVPRRSVGGQRPGSLRRRACSHLIAPVRQAGKPSPAVNKPAGRHGRRHGESHAHPTLRGVRACHLTAPTAFRFRISALPRSPTSVPYFPPIASSNTSSSTWMLSRSGSSVMTRGGAILTEAPA